MIKFKVCKKCKSKFSIDKFYSYNNGRNSGKRLVCKFCHRSKEVLRQRIKYEKSLESLRKSWRKATAKYYSKNQITIDLWKKYKISLFDYTKLLEDQGYKCKICSVSSERLVVDHDHQTGAVRGLLCKRCNLGLGWFNDNVVFLSSAIQYLQINK